MKIVILIDWFLYYSVELANALSETGEVMLVTRDHELEISPQAGPGGLKLFLDQCLSPKVTREKLRFRRRSWRNFFEIIRVCRRIRSFRPDVIHIQQNTDWRILAVVRLVGSGKTVLTIHDVTLHPGKQKDPFLGINRSLLRRASRIIIHGTKLKESLAARYPKLRDRIAVLPHGVFTLYGRWDDGCVQEDARCLLFFGNICAYKGLEALVEAGSIIAREYPDIRIVVAGRGDIEGPNRKALEQDPHFELHNRFIPNEEVFRFFRRASVVVLPYVEASQSGVIPLAYGFGKPVVATDVGSIPEVVEDGKTGYIVPPNNAAALAAAVVKILKNPNLKASLKENVRRKAATDLSWKTIASETLRVYADLVQGDE